MKKVLSLLLVTLLVFTLFSGCGSDSSKSADKKSKTDKESVKTEELEGKDASDVKKIDEDESLEVEAADEEETVEAEMSRGKIESDVYNNKYLGFKFTKPGSWIYSTDEEIAALVNIAVDQLLGEKFEEILRNNPAICDMMVYDTVTRTNVNIIYENLEKTFATNITEAQYVDVVKQQFEEVQGMTVSFPEELEKVYLGETEFTKCVCESTMGEQTFTQVFYLRNIDGYMAVITVTIMDGYTVEEIEDMFQ